jgi:hypothetical protein
VINVTQRLPEFILQVGRVCRRPTSFAAAANVGPYSKPMSPMPVRMDRVVRNAASLRQFPRSLSTNAML